MQTIERLLIVSHVTHFRHAGKLYAHAPYAREIDIWADLFPQIAIAAPYRECAPPGDAEAFTRSNITIVPQRETGGVDFKAKVKQIASLPALVWGLCRAMARADAIHVRCPGNLGLLGAALAPLFSRYRVAKYAGEWRGFPGEARSYRWQRQILKSRRWRAPVTVYGDWPDQPPHIVPFFTSVVTEDQMTRARASARRKLAAVPPSPLRVLFVGRLTRPKNTHVLLAALAQLRATGIRLCCDIVGEGPERAALEQQVDELGLRDCVSFAGGVEFAGVLDFYDRADVLVLASGAEGWGKVLVEAMAFGLVCIGSNRGVVPWILGEGRGLVIAPGDAAALAAALGRVAGNAAEFQPMREQAAVWAQRLTLEGLRDALRDLMNERW
jgi:glycosyltransferase involved in cell wall biosynthesis